MVRIVMSFTIACLACTLAWADDWTGALVDAKCWASEESNVNPHDSLTNVDRDRDGGPLLLAESQNQIVRAGGS